jgi:creatinine amidohydrolase
VAVALAARLAAEEPDATVVASAIPYGSSGEHEAFPGTVSIGAQAAELLLLELGRSATRTWDRVLFLSTHGGNHEAVTRAVARLREEGRDVRAWMPTWDGDAHAGHVETSVMLALDPDRVEMEDAPVGATDPLPTLLGRLRESGVASVSPTGVLGDATTAAASAGTELLDEAVAQLVAAVRAWPVTGERR